MKKAKKVLLLMLCAVLLVGASVAVTVAYLTDQETVTNTFTVGKVDLDLKEYEVDPQTGLKTNTVVPKLENLELVPGRTIQKNPFITVSSDSETCWLFIKVENNLGSAVTINWASGWTEVEGHNGYYMYNATVDANTKVPVFESITVAATETQATLDAIQTKNIIITAYAVQAAGIDQTAAWGALSQHYTLN